jgi:hypothetical protein
MGTGKELAVTQRIPGRPTVRTDLGFCLVSTALGSE